MRWPSDLVLAREGRTGDLQPQAPWLALHWLLTPLAGAWKLPGSRRVLGSGVAAAGLPLPPGAQGAQKRPGSCSSSGPELPASWPGTLGTPQHPSGPRDLTHAPLRFAGPGAAANRGCAIARPPGPANSRPTFPESGRPHALPHPAPAQTLTHSAWGASDTRPATRLRSGFPVHCRLSVSPLLATFSLSRMPRLGLPPLPTMLDTPAPMLQGPRTWAAHSLPTVPLPLDDRTSPRPGASGHLRTHHPPHFGRHVVAELPFD